MHFRCEPLGRLVYAGALLHKLQTWHALPAGVFLVVVKWHSCLSFSDRLSDESLTGLGRLKLLSVPLCVAQASSALLLSFKSDA